MIPNLDAMNREELMEFWRTHQSGGSFRTLFPQGGRGSINATRDLANYASNKATAMGCRVRGEIQRALMYETICDCIYKKLPINARW